MIEQQTFGVWLRERRRQLDFTQAELARRIGCSEITIRKIEANNRTPSRQIAELLAGVLHIPDDERAAFIAFARGRVTHVAPPVAEPESAPLLPPDLPLPLTPLLGRDQDVVAIRQRLLQSRLVTLIGPPGIGKTRLGLEVAAQLSDVFADGVVFVALAAIVDASLVPEAIAQSLGVAADARRSTMERLRQALRGRKLLLVLDNMEHVLASASQIAELLMSNPALTVLATSRAALHIRGEQLFPVPPLALPTVAGMHDLAAVSCSAAVQLFVERTQAVAPYFVLTSENATDVATICSRLDGMPLAIELIAARCRLLSPAALLGRLGDSPASLQLLTEGPGDLPVRHQALRSAIEWSYRLLTPYEQHVFQCLGVFAGSFDIDAVVMICGDQAIQVEQALSSLLKQSLVQLVGHQGEQTRFILLQTLREYALEQLTAANCSLAMHTRHAQYYGTLANDLQVLPAGRPQELLIESLSTDENNLRAALEWFVAHHPAAGIRCAVALRHFWLARGMLNEGRMWLARLLDSADTISPELQALALATTGFLASHQGDHRLAEALAQESLVLYRQLGDRRGEADALVMQARTLLLQSRLIEADAVALESLTIYRQLGDRRGSAEVLRSMALIAKDRCELERAADLGAESLALYRELDDRRNMARVLFNLSTIAYWQGAYSRSGDLARQAARIFRELDDRMGVAYALEGSGMVAYQQGEYAEAQRQLTRSLELLRALGDKSGMALLFQDLGQLAVARGQHHEALLFLRDGLAIAWEIGDQRRVAFCLEGLAAAHQEQPMLVARLCGAAEVLREALDAPLPTAESAGYQRLLTIARSQTSAPSFAQAWEEGSRQPLAQLVSEWISIRA